MKWAIFYILHIKLSTALLVFSSMIKKDKMYIEFLAT